MLAALVVALFFVRETMNVTSENFPKKFRSVHAGLSKFRGGLKDRKRLSRAIFSYDLELESDLVAGEESRARDVEMQERDGATLM